VLVGVVQPLGSLAGVGKRLDDGQGAALLEQPGQVGALDVFHDEEVAVLGLGGGVGGGGGLGGEAGGGPGVCGGGRGGGGGAAAAESVSRSGRMSFRPTTRFMSRCRAVNTWPMPPWPSRCKRT